MIDVKELRVGALFYQSKMYGNRAVTAYDIDKLNDLNKGCLDVAEFYKHWEPIKITDRLFKKYGMINDTVNPEIKTYSLSRFPFSFKQTAFGTYIINHEDLNIGNKYRIVSKQEFKYIHQLQNLFYAITGEELKIKL